MVYNGNAQKYRSVYNAHYVYVVKFLFDFIFSVFINIFFLRFQIEHRHPQVTRVEKSVYYKDEIKVKL